MIADYVFILYDGQYRIVKYQQEVDEKGSDDKLAWRLKQRKPNYESARMELVRLYSGELEPELTAEFPIIDEDQAVLSTQHLARMKTAMVSIKCLEKPLRKPFQWKCNRMQREAS